MSNTAIAASSIEASLASAGAKIATGGGVVSVLAFVTSAQFVAFIGIVTAILGALISWYYKRQDSAQIRVESEQRLRIQQLESEARMRIEEEKFAMEKEKHKIQILQLQQKVIKEGEKNHPILLAPSE